MTHSDDLALVTACRDALAKTTPGPWGCDSYSSIFAPDRGHDKWEGARLAEGHTLERHGLCEPCGPEWWDVSTWPQVSIDAARKNGHGCKHHKEDYERSPRVASVPAHHGDTAIGIRVKDAELIAGAPTVYDAALSLIEDTLNRHRAESHVWSTGGVLCHSHRDLKGSRIAHPCDDYNGADTALHTIATALGVEVETHDQSPTSS